MKKKNLIILLCAIVLLFIAGNINAQIPGILNFQAKITDNAGNPLSGVNSFNFAIINQSGTTTWWSANNISIDVDDGLYSIKLGDITIPGMTPIPSSVFDDNDETFLRIWVAGEQLTDQPILPVGYAHKSEYTDQSENSDKLNNQNPEYYLYWDNLLGIPSDIEDGDQIGINSIDGVSNEGDNVDFIGDGITISPDDANNTITFTATGGGIHNAGYDMLLQSQNYTIEVTTNLGHKPKIVEIAMSMGYGTSSQAKWVDEDQDGFGVLTMLYTDQNGMVITFLSDNTEKIGRQQTATSDAQDFKVETFDNMIRISKDETFGNPSLGNLIPFTWYVE
ncbi:hypothetical protein D4R71_00670 [bacterium]|nr:MAG: hypothetical protein D4R71_00670 [bacterium]